MKKIISIALFGPNYAKYSVNLTAFVRAHHNVFDGYSLRVHIDDFVAKARVGKLLGRYATAGLIDLSLMGSAVLCRSMLWRLAPLFEADADFVFSRDIDCPPMPRDYAVCEEFIRSVADGKKCCLATCHDSSSHAGIMGGLCGFHAPEFRRVMGWSSLGDIYKAAACSTEQWEKHGTDQDVLNRLCLRPGGPRLFEHRYGGWEAGKKTLGKIRPVGRYACGGISAVTPDVGLSKFKSDVAAKADQLAAHLGAAGFDHLAAVRFWKQHGDPETEAAIAACEQI